MTQPAPAHPASYRDPSGYVFQQEGIFYRMVNASYQNHYDHLIQSGLYKKLSDKGLMLAHTDVSTQFALQGNAYKVLQPEQVDFWTYPYEWSFEQLKQAALLTLQLNELGLAHDMILKDASAYNIQFVKAKPVLIDSLSFENYTEGTVWKAFRQFCTQFLYPLLLQSTTSDLNPAIFSQYPDGISAKLTASLLPRAAKYNLNNWLYVYLPAKMEGKQQAPGKTISVSKQKILQNINQLSGYIKKLKPAYKITTWNYYYSDTILSQEYLQNKKDVIEAWLGKISRDTTIDVGCNTGFFSFIAATNSRKVVSFDTDSASIDLLFSHIQKEKTTNVTGIVADICNPSPATGWNNAEHSSLLSRAKGDMVMALALIHHLALTKNVPLTLILETFANMTSKHLLIEFVPKSDPRAQQLLQSREDIFTDYTQEYFEQIVQQHFTIEQKIALKGSERTLYLLRK